jgi:arylsulfatase A-like enzyme
VVLITLDTTRRDVIAPYSGRPDLTPNLARFAESATVYTDAYATSPWTLPSHASIFTGFYPSHHRAGVVDDFLSESWATLAERFRESGYLTAGFIGGHLVSSSYGMAQGFSLYMEPRKTQETADVITNGAIGFIERGLGAPLFLFLNYFDPHGPYDAPTIFRRRLGVDELGERLLETPGWAEYVRNERHSWNPIRRGEVESTADCLAYLRARYEAEVAYMDHEIGRLFTALRDHGLFDEALIVVVADHGEFLGERGLYSHSYRLDRELTAVPLMIKWPHQEAGETVDELVSQVDLYPTIAAAAGIEVPDSDGIAFGRGRTTALTGRSPLFLEEHESRIHPLDERNKIANHLFGMQWLEAREVFFPGFIECSRRSGDQWNDAACSTTWEHRMGALPPAMRSSLELENGFTGSDLDDEVEEKLRALGYLE